MIWTKPWAFLVCPNCGRVPTPLAGDSASCPRCGRVLRSAPPTPARAAPAPTTLPAQDGFASAPPAPPVPVSVVPQAPAAESEPARGTPTGFRCPYCGEQALPRRCCQVSGEGWAVVMMLLAGVVTIPVCWLGLCFREAYQRCVGCGMRFG